MSRSNPERVCRPLARPQTGRPLAALVLCIGLLLAACGADTPQALIASGNALADKRDFRGAAVQFKAALQKDSESLEIRQLLGHALLESGDPVNAAVELNKALEQPSPPDPLRADHARALLQTGDLKKLTSMYGDVMLKDPASQASLKATLANAWGALGDRRRAESAATAALAAKPDFGPALILQARLLASGGAAKEAIAVLDQLLAREPALHEAWHLRGEILWLSLHNGEGSAQSFRKALEAKPTHLASHLSLLHLQLNAKDYAGAKNQAAALRQALPNQPYATFVDAQIAFFEQDYNRARDLALQLLKGSPNHPGTLQLAGAVEAQAGSLPMAQNYFSKALQANPELQLARRNLAGVQLRLGQPGQALATLQPALQKGGGDAEVHALAGQAHLQLGDAEAAQASFQRAATLAPDNIQVRTALALSALAKGDENRGFGELDHLAAKNTDNTADLALISARLKRHEYDKALLAAQNLVGKQPESAAAAQLLGRVQLARRDRAGARLAFEKALKLDPRYFSATASLAALDRAEKNFDRARSRYEEAIKLDPRNHLARLALADLRVAQGAPADDVTRILSEAIKASPTEASPRLALLNRHLLANNHKEALATAQAAAAALPNNTQVLDALGRTQAEAGDREQATATFKRLAGIDSTSGLAHVRLADLYKAHGDLALAEASLKQSLDIQPDLAAAQTGLLDLLLASNRPDEALATATRLQKRQPAQSNGYLLEAAVHLRTRKPQAAIETYKKGLAQVPNGSELATALHKTLVADKRWAEADKLAESWSARHPSDLSFEYQLALSAIARGQLDRAEQGLRKLVDLRPNHALALNNLAWLLVVRNKPGAVDYARRAVEALPERPALMDTLAMALAANRQVPEALELQKRAVTLSPKDSGLRLNLAKIAVTAGDKELARKELKALEAVGASLPLRDEVLKLLASL